jgi:hypothetical protein
MLKLTCMEIKILKNQTLSLKGKKETVLVNPTELQKKDVSRIWIYLSESEKNKEWNNGKVVIKGPGEYEIGGVEIVGVNDSDGNFVYKVEIDGINVGLLGKINGELSEKKQEKIEGLDVLMADITGVLEYKAIAEYAKKWGVNYLIPFGYSDDKMLVDFLDKADQEGLEPLDSLKVDPESLPDGLDVVVLKVEQ